MDPKKKAFLEAAGISVGNKAEFLGLTPAQEAVVEVKVRLSYALRRARKAGKLTQAALAEAMGVPQQTVARLESIHKSITVDMLMRALVTAGVSLEEIADEIARGAATIAADRGEVAPPMQPIYRPLLPGSLPPVVEDGKPPVRARLGGFIARGKSRFDNNLCQATEPIPKERQVA